MEYSYLSKAANNKAKRLSFLLFFAALLLFAATASFDIAYKGILQGLSILLFSFSILLLIRFVLKSFLLSVVNAGGDSFDFTVTEKYGKNNTTICRISLSNIEKAVVRTKENEKSLRAKANGRRIFSYCPDLSPERECWIFVTECGEPLVIKLSPDDTLLDILSSAAQKNNLNG